MIPRAAALQLAQDQLDQWAGTIIGPEWVVLPDKTEETPYAWVVYPITKRWLETKNPWDIPVGLGPFIISKHSGEVTNYGSAYGTEAALEKYEEEKHLYGLHVVADLDSMPARLLLKRLLPLSNQELLALVRAPETWVARGARQRLEALSQQLQKQGLATEVHPCFAFDAI